MEQGYNPQEVEEQAQQFWIKKQCFHVTEDLNKEKFYCLSMFPYPSGSLHMGHVRNYTLGDAIARYERAIGKNVLQPIGWDAFGLPAENAAIKHGVNPAVWTQKNIAAMKEQFLKLGNAYDWRREITTCDKDYYRWEQWFFIKLYEKGLVYKKNAIVNWDPVDKTVLANEQVVDGRGWRSGALIEHKEIPQWFIRITSYADELLYGLDTLDEWPEQVKQMQRNWIGRSEGLEINFELQIPSNKKLRVYTTRPDTLMGVTFLGIAPDHPLSKQLAQDNPKINEFLESCAKVKFTEAEIATLEKRGIDTGLFAKHPITGELLPIWIANFVFLQYGAGAIMGVPGHDERDSEFAIKYKLPIKIVIKDDILINSGKFDNLSSMTAQEVIADWIVNEDVGKKAIHYRLRDWGVSRQRYWGAPIPMILCEHCGTIPVPEEDLPIVLPEEPEALYSSAFTQTTCPKCGEEATRETDTFDTFVESSWYYARFACKNQDNAMLDDRAKYWTPVDQYIGGIEHAVMHLLYARFFHKVLRDVGLLNSDEPFKALLSQGMVLKDGHKMSKSKGNIVDPNLLKSQYGADTVRLFILFAAPPELSLEWSDAGVSGAHRFLKRLWAFAYQHLSMFVEISECDLDTINEPRLKQAHTIVHEILLQVNQDYERKQFNTVVSGCMKLFNHLSSYEIKTEEDKYFICSSFSILLRLLAPITPHICHILWQNIEFDKAIIDAPWPKVNKSALKKDVIEFVIQINGKLKTKFSANADTSSEELLRIASELITPTLKGTSIQKSFVIAHRNLINLVIS